jgi:hypothetical protein
MKTEHLIERGMYCPPGSILNPETLRCVKNSSHIARNLVQRGVIADYLVPIHRRTYRRHPQRKPCRPDQHRNSVTGRCRKTYRSTPGRRTLSEGRTSAPPPEWKLYIASDYRSGPEYASVLFVDTRKAVYGYNGVEYPPEAIRLDLGFIPVHIGTSKCSAQTVLIQLQRLANANLLLKKTATGWKPVAGFPYTKKDWEHNGESRLMHLCQMLSNIF